MMNQARWLGLLSLLLAASACVRNAPAYEDLHSKPETRNPKLEEAPTPGTITRLSNSFASLLGIDGKQYKTVFDRGRNIAYMHATPDSQFAETRKNLDDYAEFQRKKLFQSKPSRPLYIVMLSSKDAQKFFPDGQGGCFIPAENILLCGNVAAKEAATKTSVITHELTHALHSADMIARKQEHPIWLAEGLATLFESSHRQGDDFIPSHSYRLEVLQQAIRTEGHIPWKTLMKMNQQEFLGPKAQLAYAQARYMLFYFNELDLLKKFYDQYTSDERFATDAGTFQAFELVFGKSVESIERDWKQWVMNAVLDKTSPE